MEDVATNILMKTLKETNIENIRMNIIQCIKILKPSIGKVLTIDDFIKTHIGTKHFHMGVSARTDSGKTTFVRQLAKGLIAKGIIKNVFVFSPNTTQAKKNYGDLIVADDFNVQFSDEALQELLEYQISKQRRGKGQPTLVILDDILGTKDGENSKVVNTFFSAGRQQQIYTIAISQVGNRALSPVIKENCRLIMFYRLNPRTASNLHDFFILNPPWTKKNLIQWSLNLPQHTFGVCDQDQMRIVKVKADLDSTNTNSGNVEETLDSDHDNDDDIDDEDGGDDFRDSEDDDNLLNNLLQLTNISSTTTSNTSQESTVAEYDAKIKEVKKQLEQALDETKEYNEEALNKFHEQLGELYRGRRKLLEKNKSNI